MSDNPATPASTDPAQSTDPASQAPALGPQDPDTLPAWARKAISDANADAAKYRSQKNEAADAARAATTNEYEVKLAQAATDLDATKVALAGKEVELLKLHAALGLDIPVNSVVKFASMLSGTTEEEIKSHAQEAKDLFGIQVSDAPTDPSQGRGNNHIPLNGDPLLAAVKAAVGIR